MTPLRISWGARSVIAYKRDIGLGGGPVDGLPRAIDLWWKLAGALRIPYEDGRWSGPVRVARPPASGAGPLLGDTSDAVGASVSLGASDGVVPSGTCGAPTVGSTPAPVISGPRAQLLPDGMAAAPAAAPAAVRGIIAAGNQIVGRPYQYGGGHGLPLDERRPDLRLLLERRASALRRRPLSASTTTPRRAALEALRRARARDGG